MKLERYEIHNFIHFHKKTCMSSLAFIKEMCCIFTTLNSVHVVSQNINNNGRLMGLYNRVGFGFMDILWLSPGAMNWVVFCVSGHWTLSRCLRTPTIGKRKRRANSFASSTSSNQRWQHLQGPTHHSTPIRTDNPEKRPAWWSHGKSW